MAQPYDISLEELKKYKPCLTKQPDFEDFWNNSKKKLSSVPIEYKLTEYDYPVHGIKVYRISYLGFESANIDGWFAVPNKDRPHPGMVLFHGYNWALDGQIHDVVNLALKGYATLIMLVRGQQGESVDNVVSSSGFTAGWMTKGILSPEEYYYRAVYLDALRAVEVLASMDNVDESRIGVTGGSQGGGLTLAAAALSDIPKVAIADYPYLSHFERAIEITPTGPYLEINEYLRRNTHPKFEEQAKKTLSYFDIMNLAPLIKSYTWISSGLIDEVTPPSTIFAAYNHLKCQKEISVHRYFGHEYIPSTVEPKLRLMMDFLQ